ncbi:MAG: hypothetical protein L0H53_10565 [Candidatus Nitrosocosmicus sp.]|nr:hypothetical protein [Candidatus Nitrosocosmicus sp.]MDN5868103.1 hypothetical protein [Candidatus Nitrosocosmicus sp.]
MSYENNHTSKDDNNSKKIPLIFEVTENVSRIGITDIILDRKILQFISNKKIICGVVVKTNKPSLGNLCEDIRNKLFKKLEHSVSDLQTLEASLSNIENQILEKRDEIFLKPTSSQEQDDKNDPDEQFKIEFQKEVSILRKYFAESSDPYKEWQLKVAEKYKNLEKIFKSHYPEAWMFMEFCLSVKSILNIMDFTLPFMGVLVAPPSSLKTMVIQLFRKYHLTFYTDSFTPSSLVSHNAGINRGTTAKNRYVT